jgi:UDP-N-acetylglucosamine 2-epimerase (non-hydrolysing)
MKIMFILGTRPEAIKLAPLILAARNEVGFDSVVCNTGQHSEMATSALSLFGIQPDIGLGIMRAKQTLAEITCGVLTHLPAHLERFMPDWLVVQGDTSTTFASSLVAFYQSIAVAHVEAGLRSGNMYAPWPEEMNRCLVSKIASLHFAPTPIAAENLVSEGVSPKNVTITGNTGIDALLSLVKRLKSDIQLQRQAAKEQTAAGILSSTIDGARPHVLITAHRRENHGKGLESICEALVELAIAFPDRDFIFPVHPNPAVRQTVFAECNRHHLRNLSLVEPLSYLSFVDLMFKAELLITDSGGVQEEGPSLGKRIIVLRESTERAEGLATDMIRLAGTDPLKIVSSCTDAFSGRWAVPLKACDLYGDGNASRRILNAIRERHAENLSMRQ